MKINHIINEFVQTAPMAVPADDNAPAHGYAIKVHGPLGTRQGGVAANAVWYALSAVFPDQYPPKDFDNPAAQMDSPQRRVLNQIQRVGSAVVADGIASRDLAETLANKLATFNPNDPYINPIGSKHVEVVESGLEEDITRRGFLQGAGAAVAAAAGGTAMAQPVPVKVDKVDVKAGTITVDGEEYRLVMLKPGDFRPRGGRWIAVPMAQFGHRSPGNFTATIIGDTVYVFPDAMHYVSENRRGSMPDPQNFDSDWDYEDAMERWRNSDSDDDVDYENYPEPDDDWFDESKEKVGNMDADAFDDAISRLKKLAGAGPLKTVYDPAKRVYKNVPHAVQPTQQPKKAR
jgi:hypothetical protein